MLHPLVVPPQLACQTWRVECASFHKRVQESPLHGNVCGYLLHNFEQSGCPVSFGIVNPVEKRLQVVMFTLENIHGRFDHVANHTGACIAFRGCCAA